MSIRKANIFIRNINISTRDDKVSIRDVNIFIRDTRNSTGCANMMSSLRMLIFSPRMLILLLKISTFLLVPRMLEIPQEAPKFLSRTPETPPRPRMPVSSSMISKS